MKTYNKIFSMKYRNISAIFIVIPMNATLMLPGFMNYTVFDINEEFNPKNLKKIDASNLPPCKTELFQQFLRAYYITSI